MGWWVEDGEEERKKRKTWQHGISMIPTGLKVN
jgi:hypothetical protein